MPDPPLVIFTNDAESLAAVHGQVGSEAVTLIEPVLAFVGNRVVPVLRVKKHVLAAS